MSAGENGGALPRSVGFEGAGDYVSLDSADTSKMGFAKMCRKCGAQTDTTFAPYYARGYVSFRIGCSAQGCGNVEIVGVPLLHLLDIAGALDNPLARLAKTVVEINRANGWNVLTPEVWEDPYRIPASLALLTSEVSEALEGFRMNDYENFVEELADVQIRLLDTAGGLGIDLDEAVAKKLERNRSRGFRHGGKKV